MESLSRGEDEEDMGLAIEFNWCDGEGLVIEFN